MKPTILLLILSLLVPVTACLFDNFYAAEAEWVSTEPFLIECYTKQFRENQAAVFELVDQLSRAYPHVTWQPNVMPLIMKPEEEGNRDKVPIVVVKNDGEGFSVTLARFEKRIPTVKDIAPLFRSKTKDKLSTILQKNVLALLVITGKHEAENKAFMACAKKAQKMTREMVKIESVILSAGLQDKSESILFKNVLFGNNGKRPGILVLFGKGKALHFVDNPANANEIMEMAQKLGLETNTEAHDLKPRLLINMPVPRHIVKAGIEAAKNPRPKTGHGHGH